MKKKGNTRKNYTPNEIFQLIGYNPNTNGIENKKTTQNNFIANNAKDKRKSKNKKNLEKENPNKLNSTNIIYNTVSSKVGKSNKKFGRIDKKPKENQDGDSMEFEYEYSNDHKEDNIKDALINENKEEINININSDIDSENIDNRDENIINELKDFEPNIKNRKQYNNHKYGLANKAYFLEKYQQSQGNIFNKNEFILRDVKSDGNCGYRCISLQLYGEEDKYYIIREMYINI